MVAFCSAGISSMAFEQDCFCLFISTADRRRNVVAMQQCLSFHFWIRRFMFLLGALGNL
jgi:hypothetical protein